MIKKENRMVKVLEEGVQRRYLPHRMADYNQPPEAFHDQFIYKTSRSRLLGFVLGQVDDTSGDFS